MEPVDAATAVDSLMSTTCPACSRKKGVRKSLCYTCFMALPEKLRQALYNDVWNGYGEHLAAALDHMDITTPQWAKRSPRR